MTALDGRTALVTGGAQGIGWGTSLPKGTGRGIASRRQPQAATSQRGEKVGG